jgi:predicted acetyltransferase
MEMRRLTAEDRPAHSALMAEAFDGGRRPTPGESGETGDGRPSVTWGIFDGTRLVAAATVHVLHVTWGDHDAPLGGVAGVACVADQRGRGHVARLMERSLEGMRDDGQYLSGLYPFSFAFYRRHGWEWVGEKRNYTVPTAQLHGSPEGRQMRFYDGPAALEVVRPVHAAFARRYRGMTTRCDPYPDWWDRTLSHHDNKTTYVHVHHDADTGAADGYLTFRYDSSESASLGDFFALTPAAYRGLLSVLHYYGTQVKNIDFHAPADDPLPLHMMHWDLNTEVQPVFMGDVKAALEALHPPSGLAGEIVLAVSDGQCAWNDAVWAVTLEGGQVSVARTQKTPGVSLDIQALTQAYWGQPSVRLLRAAGHLVVSDEGQFRLFETLLPSAVCYSQDHF